MCSIIKIPSLLGTTPGLFLHFYKFNAFNLKRNKNSFL